MIMKPNRFWCGGLTLTMIQSATCLEQKACWTGGAIMTSFSNAFPAPHHPMTIEAYLTDLSFSELAMEASTSLFEVVGEGFHCSAVT